MHLNINKTTLLAVALLAVWACANSEKSQNDAAEDARGSDSADTSDGHGNSDGDTDGDITGDITGNTDSWTDPVCETTNAKAELASMFLAIAFDVSGSMGHLDRPNWWHDPLVKWDPVVDVVTSFFADDSTVHIHASMVLFPSTGTNEEKCSADTYQVPDVSMTALPSSAFETVLKAYEAEVGTPLAGGNWRGGTPTLAAFTGTAAYLDSVMSGRDDARFAVVLITDGLPQSCGADNSLADTIAAIEAHHSETGIPTYVIGIENPTTPPDALPSFWADWGCGDANADPCTPPDTLDDLHELARVGGTTSAFLIDTGNPEATRSAFGDAIDQIRLQTVSCDLEIPEHPVDGMVFEKDKIDVSVTLTDETVPFAYDPDCDRSMAWRYNDVSAPEFIELCPQTCATIQAEPDAALQVNFLCETRVDIE